jgi:hypothetical protein
VVKTTSSVTPRVDDVPKSSLDHLPEGVGIDIPPLIAVNGLLQLIELLLVPVTQIVTTHRDLL